MHKLVSLEKYLSANANSFAGKMFIRHRNAGITYDAMDAACEALARFLREGRIRRGDRVAIFLENSIEYAVSLFGIMRAGGIAVPLSERHTDKSAGHLLKDFEPSAVIMRRKLIDSFRGMMEEVPSIRTIVHADECYHPDRKGKDISAIGGSPAGAGGRSVRLSEILKALPSGERIQGPWLTDKAMIIYTSGTTGSPKGVVLTHGNLVANAWSIIRYLKLTDADSIMVVLPLFYSYGNSLLTTHLISGGTLVLENGFLYPNVVLEKMEENGVTGFAGIPSTFSILLHRTDVRSHRFPRLRYVTQAGGPLSPSHAEELQAVLPGSDIYIMYGLTEATARLTWLDPRDLKSKKGSIGKPIPGVEITLKKENGKEAGVGEVGEIVAQGENIMSGYWNSPAETENVLRSDGLHTGDLAWRDREGYLYLVGRRTDMIKSGSHRIGPKEIEDVILEHRDVAEAAVIGMPDDLLGEAVNACVVLKNGNALDEKEVIRHCSRYLPPFKLPKKVVFFDDLPKTTSGKVRRGDLAEILKGLN